LLSISRSLCSRISPEPVEIVIKLAATNKGFALHKHSKRENFMEKQIFAVGERADKLCAKCEEERGHIVTSVTKRGHISRVSCPKCGTVSTFKLSARTSPRQSNKAPLPYDRTCTYRAGQTMAHQTFGIGEVTKLIEPRKIDVLFQDRLRRLIHAQS
jgi:ssDNA-binding Zn-finger/Zn-ribbon topoisomerase 1